ncbi:MAG: hypothetical protein ACOC0O_07155 [Spirochaetota bacterium]
MSTASGGRTKMRIVAFHELNELPPTTNSAANLTTANYVERIERGYDVGLGNADYRAIAFDPRFGIVGSARADELDAVWVFGVPGSGFWETCMLGPDAIWVNGAPRPDIDTGRNIVVYGFGKEAHQNAGFMLENTAHMAECILDHVSRSWPRKHEVPVYTSLDVGWSGRRLENRTLNDYELYTLSASNSFLAGLTAPDHAQAGISHFPPASVHNYDWSSTESFPLVMTESVPNRSAAPEPAGGATVGRTFPRPMLAADGVFRATVRWESVAPDRPPHKPSLAGIACRLGGDFSNENAVAYVAGISRSGRLLIARMEGKNLETLAAGETQLDPLEPVALALTVNGSRIELEAGTVGTLGNRLAVTWNDDRGEPTSPGPTPPRAGAFGVYLSHGAARFSGVQTEPHTVSGYEQWHDYPVVQASGHDAGRIVRPATNWEGGPAGSDANLHYLSLWFEHLPKAPGYHLARDLGTGREGVPVLNDWWIYLFDLDFLRKVVRMEREGRYSQDVFARVALDPRSLETDETHRPRPRVWRRFTTMNASRLHETRRPMTWASRPTMSGVTACSSRHLE